jgi:RNA polymerase sigma-70 factor (ECF subfamily)
MDASIEDQEDMQRLAEGADDSLDALMQRHSPRLFHYLLRMVQNESAAGDLAEEAFVRVYQNRMKFKQGSRFTTWLYAIATNLARDYLRTRGRHPHVSLEAHSEGEEPDFHERIADNQPNPGERLVSSEQAEKVRQAISELPEDLRTPIILSVYEEKSHAEIAEIVGCSAKAVEMRIYHARTKLSEILMDRQGQPT